MFSKYDERKLLSSFVKVDILFVKQNIFTVENRINYCGMLMLSDKWLWNSTISDRISASLATHYLVLDMRLQHILQEILLLLKLAFLCNVSTYKLNSRKFKTVFCKGLF